LTKTTSLAFFLLYHLHSTPSAKKKKIPAKTAYPKDETIWSDDEFSQTHATESEHDEWTLQDAIEHPLAAGHDRGKLKQSTTALRKTNHSSTLVKLSHQKYSIIKGLISLKAAKGLSSLKTGP
jgi:hypothetical protein